MQSFINSNAYYDLNVFLSNEEKEKGGAILEMLLVITYPGARALKRLIFLKTQEWHFCDITSKLSTMASGVIRLEWDTFQTNIAEQYQELRGVKDFTDVTLVSEDLAKTDAHRIVLAAGSTFFNKVLGGEEVKKHRGHPLIFLPGLTKATLKPLLDFFYSGEATLAQEDLPGFLLISKRLGVKGLTQDDDNSAESKNETRNSKDDGDPNQIPKIKDLGKTANEKNPRLKQEVLESSDFAEEQFEGDLFDQQDGNLTCKVCGVTLENESECSGHMKQHLGEMQKENGTTGRKDARKRSQAWNYFTPNDKLSASCTICAVEIKTSGGTTSSLYNHLKGKHPLEYARARGMALDMDVSVSDTPK